MADSDTGTSGYRDAEIRLRDCDGEFPAFFRTPEREGLIEQLLHLVQFGEGLPVLVGDAGMGKSSLLSHLGQRLDQVDYCAHLELSGATRLAQALSALLTSFKVKPKAGAGELLAQVRHFAQQLASEQMKAVLLLDNAHHLDDAALGAIISLLQGNDAPGFGLQLVFSSKPGLVERMDALELVDVPVYDFAMPALTSAQLSDFLLSREYNGDKSALLSKSDVTRIWGKTLGNPGLSLSLIASPKSKPVTTSPVNLVQLMRGVPVGHIIAMVLLVSVLVWALLVREDPSESRITEIPIATVPHSENKDPTPSISPDELSDTPKPPNLDNPLAASKQTATLPADVSDVGLLEPASIPVAKEVAAPEADTEADVAPEVPTLEPTASPEPKPVRQAEQNVAKLSEDERFLLSRSDSEFSLQVMAASQKPALQSYVMRQPNREDLYIYEVNRDGRRLFVVLTGVFPSKDQALLARKSLPKEQQNAGPWPRSLADIKREINAIRR